MTVSDNGPGISTEEKSQVFKKFYRSGNEETRNSKGTGLGLYIVDFIIRKHNAEINIKDRKPKGTSFEVQFNEA